MIDPIASTLEQGEAVEHVAKRRARLRKMLRAEWIAGAEEEWLRRTGRTMTAELARVLRSYPGDV